MNSKSTLNWLSPLRAFSAVPLMSSQRTLRLVKRTLPAGPVKLGSGCAAFSARTPDNANRDIDIITEPNTKVIYWASEPKDASNNGIANWNEAYGDYSNSGVSIADDKGRAILRIRGPPQSYKAPLKGTIQPHVHYRICQKNGMVGPVQIYFISTGRTEAFKNYF